MASHPPGRYGRAVISLLIVALGAGLGVGGVLLLRSRAAGPPRASVAGAQGTAGAAVGPRVIYSRLAPTVVDITATLRYDGETASGTGFVVDARNALVLTNNHVIRDATAVTARLTSTGRTYRASIVGTDVGADIAVLKLEGAAGAPGLTAAPLGDTAAVTAGTPVLAIGNQAGKNGPPTAASGVVNGLNRTIQAGDSSSGFTETLHGMLETSARMEPGDSGGPLAGPSGTVIGVDTAAGTGASPTGYAIPIGVAMAVERQIAAGRTAPGITLGTGGFLGVVVTPTASASPRTQARQEQRLAAAGAVPGQGSCLDTEAGAGVPATIAPARSGALVDGVLCGTGAAQAGIAPGDVITAAAGHPVSSPSVLTAIVNGLPQGTVVRVTWIAVAGAMRTSLIRLTAAPAL